MSTPIDARSRRDDGPDNAEAQPLLSGSPSSNYSLKADGLPTRDPREVEDGPETTAIPGDDSELEVSDAIDTTESVKPERKGWTKGQIAWRALLAAVVVFFLALFIKGFVDAKDTKFDFGKAFKDALGGGVTGAAAMVLQVLLLMPLRTVMNYQYRYGTSTTQAIKTLYADGGYPRYYQGILAALIQGPVARFGDTAFNVGILSLLRSNSYMKKLPVPVQTIFASVASACFRMVLTPIDTVKTTMQTQGKVGMKLLKERVKRSGVGSLWYGALATAAANFVGNYPWFATFNWLDAALPPGQVIITKLLRSAFIGFCAAIVSDTISNSLRVLKTYRQVNETEISYSDAARAIIATDGLKGLFGRGLKTRILTNGLQSLMFTVLWKLFLDM
ncbi:mitochondrial carrier [Coniophora puteana RWD-64-598 SS2]|uniref:Mitochondrial carrier n=1 Tax=Coniophora puteana (strain RWD-64-598) TaxID=741705 RepID=A0A5M3MG06_CONPW|nr:mitochondrial carrier [Coniophora puteana RWD-64-598 SS2]EIW78093.1 mitochondrial carrier [Coniophora puteana RWD-64-598 SS2]